MSPILISIVAFIGVAALVAAVANLFAGESESKIEDRLQLLAGAGTAAPSGKDSLFKQGGLLVQPLSEVPSVFEQVLKRFGRTRLLFEQADTTLTANKFFAISGGLAVAAMAGTIVSGVGVAAPLAGLFMGSLPLLWLMWRRKRRLKAFSAQLPDALELIGRALRAGHSLAAGFNLVQNEMTAPISVEFGRVFEEQNLGIPLDEALRSLTDRVPNLDLQFFATAVVLQRQTGGDLAEILDKIGHLVRERFKIWGQVQALTGEGRLSGIVLLALPPVLFLVVYRLNPDYVSVLFTDPLGKKMLIGATLLQILGALAIRKIVNIKV